MLMTLLILVCCYHFFKDMNLPEEVIHPILTCFDVGSEFSEYLFFAFFILFTFWFSGDNTDQALVFLLKYFQCVHA